MSHLVDALAPLVRDIIEHPELRATLRSLLREAVREEAPKAEALPSGLLSPSATARALGISVSTLNRAAPPSHVVGARARYDVAEVRAFFAARGRVATTPKKSRGADPIDVDNVARLAGLRVVGGGR